MPGDSKDSSNSSSKPVREPNGTPGPSGRDPENTSDQDRPERVPWYGEDDMSMIRNTHEGSSEQVDKEQNDHSAASTGSPQRLSAQDSTEHTGTSTGNAWDFLRTPDLQMMLGSPASVTRVPTPPPAPAGQSTAGSNGDSNRPAPQGGEGSTSQSGNMDFVQPLDRDSLEELGFLTTNSK
ncbi:hypothetical protein H2202_001357 [Exophiala xenobiotica]|nr:hypothetical protein H2202_001357 [Exophiala xenobiotica]